MYVGICGHGLRGSRSLGHALEEDANVKLSEILYKVSSQIIFGVR